MRRIPIVNDQYYHIYNRGYGKQDIFLHENDYARFLFALLCFQSPVVFSHLSRSPFGQLPVLTKGRLELSKEEVEEIIRHRFVEMVAFTLMPNHFHAVVKQTSERGIAQHMQRVLNSYTKYFNIKYERTGHLFQGQYQIVLVESNEQLLYLSAYIHRNQREINKWRDREHEYPWSSYPDYVSKNRWGDLLKMNILLDQFDSPRVYRGFVEESGAKDADGQLPVLTKREI
jgi:putative transposase